MIERIQAFLRNGKIAVVVRLTGGVNWPWGWQTVKAIEQVGALQDLGVPLGQIHSLDDLWRRDGHWREDGVEHPLDIVTFGPAMKGEWP